MPTNNKVILVIIDGAGFAACVRECGYLEGLVQLGKAHRWKMQCALPSISAPLYETIHTGIPPTEHGITCNESLRQSKFANIFSEVSNAGLSTAAVAHSYFFTLYAGEPYDLLQHVEYENPKSSIQHGRFYSMEAYSKSNICAPAEIDLCAQTQRLISAYSPNYLLLHTSSVDSIGHAYGGQSREYHRQIYQVDAALGRSIPQWIEQGYDVIVTADHGMNDEGHHGGTESIVRSIPFYYIGAHGRLPDTNLTLDQCAIAPSVLTLLNVDVPDSMKTQPFF